MINIAIIEDEESCGLMLENSIVEWGKKENVSVNCVQYRNAMDFFDEFKCNFDLIFMDIEMPFMNGMSAAERLRQLDKNVLLVFVTNMRQYAIHGYSVDAIDFIIKPVSPYTIATLMNKANRILGSRETRIITVRQKTGMQKIYANTIMWVEVYHHKIVYYTENGQVETWGTLKEIEEQLPTGFARVNVGVLVSLKFVSAVCGDDAVLMNGERLKISRNRKKEFLNAMATYIGGGGV